MATIKELTDTINSSGTKCSETDVQEAVLAFKEAYPKEYAQYTKIYANPEGGEISMNVAKKLIPLLKKSNPKKAKPAKKETTVKGDKKVEENITEVTEDKAAEEKPKRKRRTRAEMEEARAQEAEKPEPVQEEAFINPPVSEEPGEAPVKQDKPAAKPAEKPKTAEKPKKPVKKAKDQIQHIQLDILLSEGNLINIKRRYLIKSGKAKIEDLAEMNDSQIEEVFDKNYAVLSSNAASGALIASRADADKLELYGIKL